MYESHIHIRDIFVLAINFVLNKKNYFSTEVKSTLFYEIVKKLLKNTLNVDVIMEIYANDMFSVN